MNVTRPPTAIVTSFGTTPDAVMRIVAVLLTLPPPVVGTVVVVGVGVGMVGLDPPPPQDAARVQTITTIGESAVARFVISYLVARALPGPAVGSTQGKDDAEVAVEQLLRIGCCDYVARNLPFARRKLAT
jgi:hypothetical protein